MIRIIPPPEKVLTGAIYEFLMSDINLLPSHRIVIGKNQYLATIEVSEDDFEKLLKVRRDEGLSTLTFWEFVTDIITNKSTYTTFNDDVGVYGLEIWMEAPVGALGTLVPVGMHDSDDGEGNQLTWGVYSPPIATSLDNTKCILRTNVNGKQITMDEMLILINAATQSPNVRVLNRKEVRAALDSARY